MEWFACELINFLVRRDCFGYFSSARMRNRLKGLKKVEIMEDLNK